MTNLDSDKINLYLNNNIDNLYRSVKSAAEKNKGKEENFRVETAIIINDIFRDLNINSKINPEQEFSVANGRIDSLYGNIIIEYKAPGKISKNNNSSQNKKAIKQVKKQILGLSKKNGVPKEKILGTIFNGEYYTLDWLAGFLINEMNIDYSFDILMLIIISTEK